jgi:hypothetical protein
VASTPTEDRGAVGNVKLRIGRAFTFSSQVVSAESRNEKASLIVLPKYESEGFQV